LRGLHRNKIKAIYNIPNVPILSEIPPRNELILRELSIGPNEKVVAMVGNFYLDRGIRYFLDGARSVLEVRRDVRFLVIGDGPLRKELRMQAEQHNLMENLQFLGTRRDIEAIYSVIDLLVNPVLTGAGTGNVTAEAMAFAKPVVATNYGGLRELVKHMQTGILVPPRDGRAIAKAILYLLKNEDFRIRMGQKGRERILSDFTPDQVAAKVEQVYAHVLNGGCIGTQHASLGRQSI
jgi:glycosyltransferase involved in cell wall biosynthesis